MKILMCCSNPFLPQHHGGIEQHILDLSLSLGALGHEVHLASGLMSGDFIGLQ